MLVGLLALAQPVGLLGGQSLNLEEVLARMDHRGRSLWSLTARIFQKKWTHVLEEFDQGEGGRVYFIREKGELYIRKDITHPGMSTLVIQRDELLFYQPRIKQALKYRLGENKDKAEFLLLGFSSRKEELKAAYVIQLLGTESLQGEETYMVELIPKSKKVSAYFSKIVLWIDSDRWLPIQQKLIEPTQDYLLIRFHDLRVNSRISKSKFELRLPKDVDLVEG